MKLTKLPPLHLPLKVKHAHYRIVCTAMFAGVLCAHFVAPEVTMYLEFVAGTMAVYDPFV